MLKHSIKIQGIVFAVICLWLSAPQTANATLSSDSSALVKPNVTYMKKINTSQLPTWSTVNSARSYSQTSANTCTGLDANSTQGNCSSKAYAASIGVPNATAPLCPAGYTPINVFGTDANSPSGTSLYYTNYDYHYPVNASQYTFYTANNYTCGPVNYFYGAGSYITSTSTPFNDYYYLSTLYPSPYFYIPTGYVWVYPNAYYTIQNNFVYLTAIEWWYYRYCYTQPHVPAPDSSCGTVAGAYWEYTFNTVYYAYMVYCSRNAGWYPAPTSSTYPTATVFNIYQPTTAVCGKATNAWVTGP